MMGVSIRRIVVALRAPCSFAQTWRGALCVAPTLALRAPQYAPLLAGYVRAKS